MTRPNNVTTNYGYDNLSRLTSVLHQLAESIIDGASYTVDAAGNRSSKTDQLAHVTSNYTYDPLYQLTGVTQAGSTTESYNYDPVGNRLSSLGVSSYTTNNANELTATPTATYTYDNNGNTTSKIVGSNTTSYSWDYENRLTQVTLPGSGGTVTFKYDPLGRRIEKVSSAGTSIFTYDKENLIETVDASGAVVARDIQGQHIDEPLVELRSGTTSYYEADALGSATSLTSSGGALAQTYTYDSFGNRTGATGSVKNMFQYTGRELDDETGLYYDRARYYDPQIGRFISEDPIRLAGGINMYGYTNANPINLVDPFGLSAINILVIPVTTTATSTQGIFVVQVNGNTQFQGYGLEPSGTDPNGGRLLPPGVYPATPYNSPKEGYTDLLLHDTDPMTNVEIHKGNTARDTEGCILPGTTQSPDFVGNSGPAFHQMMSIIIATEASDAASGQNTTITVTQF